MRKSVATLRLRLEEREGIGSAVTMDKKALGLALAWVDIRLNTSSVTGRFLVGKVVPHLRKKLFQFFRLDLT